MMMSLLVVVRVDDEGHVWARFEELLEVTIGMLQ